MSPVGMRYRRSPEKPTTSASMRAPSLPSTSQRSPTAAWHPAASSVSPTMRVSTPSTGGGGNCSTRRVWRSSKLARLELRAASGIGALFAEDCSHDVLDAGLEPLVDLRRVRGHAAAAARHHRILDDRPGPVGARGRELLPDDARILRV